MRVAIIDPSLFTWPYDRRLAASLRSAGHEVTIVGRVVRPSEQGAGDPLLVQHFYPRIARLREGALPRRLVRLAKGVGHAGAMVRLTRWLESWRPDVIHFQWLPLPIVDRLFIPRLKRIAPVVLTVHDSNPFNGEAGTAVQRAGVGAALALFDHIVVHNRRAAERLSDLGVPPGRISTIAHGLLSDDAAPPPPAPPPAPSASPRRAAEADGEAPVFLQFGKIKGYKGVDVLIRAVSLMPPEVRRRCRFEVVGEPHLDPRPLLELARGLGVGDAIAFDLRFVSDDEMLGHFGRAAAAVFPYREIDTSGVLMVALAAGVPIVASAVGGFAEMLEDGRKALLVPPGDERALAGALTRLATDPGLRAAMRAEVVALAAAVPTWEDIAAATASVYTGLLAPG